MSCIDCGVCGFHVDLLSGLRWYEMDRATRRAFRLNQDHNPPGQNPGTGHWKYARCNKYLQEWADWDDGIPSNSILRDALLKERDCDGFTQYRPGLTPQEHPSSDQYAASGTPVVPTYEVFLSHAEEDDELAARVAELLRASGIKAFTTGPGFPTGMWSDEVRAALEESENFWLLLTEKALDRSVYVHHEFGYFFGYRRHKDSSVDARVVGSRLRYLLATGDDRRPGMYQHFQDFPIDDFDDPVLIARIIAQEIGKDFKEPDDPVARFMRVASVTESPPEIFDSFRSISLSISGDVAESKGIVRIRFNTPITLFDVSVAAWHPQVCVTVSGGEAQIPKGGSGEVKFTLEWSRKEGPPDSLLDSAGRRFRFERPRDPGQEWHPLYIAFESDRHGIWAFITYFKVTTHQKGFPEFSLIPAPAAFGWVRGEREG